MSKGFYYDPAAPRIDWEGRGTVVLVNPERLPRDPDLVNHVRARLPDLAGHIWVATSGTDGGAPGRVRWVALAKEAFLVSARAVNGHLAAGPADVWAHALPIFHVGGLGVLARAWLSGAAVVPCVERRWDPAVFHACARASGATLGALVPSQVHDLVQAQLPAPPAMRAVVVGGARLAPDLYAAARALGWPCLPSYGLTETCSQVATASLATLDSPDYPALLPVLPHAEVRADDERRLSVRSASLLTCVAEIDGDDVLVSDPKRDGWLETGDLGRVSGRAVDVIGRASESVKILGELVSLPRVEEQLLRWAGETGLSATSGFDLAVVALPHPRLGHELVAAIVLPHAAGTAAGDATMDATTDAAGTAAGYATMDAAGDAAGSAAVAARDAAAASMEAFSRRALAPYERVRRLVWVGAVPRTALGKCQRALLARQVGDQAGPDR